MLISKNKFILLALFLLLSICWIAGADDTIKNKVPLNVPRIKSDIKVDGVLDDPLWKQALKVEIKYEVSPGENIEAPVKTEVFLAYTETHLLVAFKAFDPKPEEILANLNDRDAIFRDDWVAIVLDTFNDEKRSLVFFSNPLGIQADEIESTTGADAGWDAIWDSAGQVHDWGYAVEMAIPFSSLRFQSVDGEQVWGFDAVRSYPRNVRHHLGTFARDRNKACYLCQAIKIKGFAGIESGNNIELTPTVTSVYSQNKPNLPNGNFATGVRESELGLTGSWGITNNINLGATINPDFSHVEADAAQLNVNRAYALYYGEKRPFFMEGADFFNTRLNVVYTRSMADPIWGTKISGKEGSHTFGGYIVEDDITNLIFPGATHSRSTSLAQKNTSSVFRYKKDFGDRNTVGALFTGREGDDYHNRVFSIDGEQWFTENDFVRYQLVGSNTAYPGQVASDFNQEQESFSGHSLEVLYVHAERNYSLVGLYRNTSAGFRTDLGFNTQVDWKFYVGEGTYIFYPDSSTWWNSLSLEAEILYIENQDGDKLHNINNFNINFNGAYQSSLRIHNEFGSMFYNGKSFQANSYSVSGSFVPSGNFTVGGMLNWGDQIDYGHTRPGTKINISPYINFRINKNINISAGYEFERVSVDQGHLYSASIFELIAYYQFDSRSYLKTHIKYMANSFNSDLYAWDQNPEDKDIYTQLLYSYKINPRTVFFLGYTDNYYGNHRFGVTQKDRTVFVKLGYSWNL